MLKQVIAVIAANLPERPRERLLPVITIEPGGAPPSAKANVIVKLIGPSKFR